MFYFNIITNSLLESPAVHWSSYSLLGRSAVDMVIREACTVITNLLQDVETATFRKMPRNNKESEWRPYRYPRNPSGTVSVKEN